MNNLNENINNQIDKGYLDMAHRLSHQFIEDLNNSVHEQLAQN